MCLILFAYKSHPRYPLILAANRDEFYERPTAPMAYWQDHPHVLAGRDLKAMGTWMGITKQGRLAAVTNYREPGIQNPDALSRGALVADYLTSAQSPADYLKEIETKAQQYNGFNLLVGNFAELHYYSNRSPKPTALDPGIYGLSNHLLDTDWPKIGHGKTQLAELIQTDGDISIETTNRLLQNQTKANPDQLPDTGVGLEWETLLSSIFITSPTYGTFSSTVLLTDNNQHVQVSEYTWRHGQPEPQLKEKKEFNFTIAV